MLLRWLVRGAALGLAIASCAPPPPAAQQRATAPDRCDDIVTCEASCKHGRAASCVEAAKRMRHDPLAASPMRLVDVLGRACDGGHGESCTVLSRALRASPSLPRDEPRERTLDARACNLGEAVSCLDLADVPAPSPAGSAGPSRPVSDASARLARTLSLAEAGCAAGKGRSCGLVAALYLGLGVAADPAKHAAYQKKAGEALEASCLGGAADDCMLAVMTLGGVRGDGELERVQRLLNQGCQLGSGEVCAELARRATTSPAAARAALLRMACDDGREDGCFALVEIQREGASSPAARSVAGSLAMQTGLRLARAHCELGETRGCDALAAALARDAVPPAEAAEVADYLERACDRGALLTCNGLAEALLRGPVALRDEPRGARLKKKACDLGYPFACADPVGKLRGAQ